MDKITFGDNIKMTIEGGSHDKCMRLTLAHFPNGVYIDKIELQKFIDRRRPSSKLCGTPRNEIDIPKIISGLDNNSKTTNENIVIEIENNDVNKSDYNIFDDMPRPSHADYVAHVKYGSAISGGGMFSGRITIMYVIAGFFALTYLKEKNISVNSFIKSIGCIERNGYDVNKPEDFSYIKDISDEMVSEIKRAGSEKDSVGGVIEGIILGLPVGLGDVGFFGLESKISSALYGIPAVKGVDFGAGFGISKKSGSVANDEFCFKNGIVKTKSNNNGGINGGISNGMPIVVNVAFKPTPSIGKPQNTISFEKGYGVFLEISGRHDACIVARAGVIVESMLALVILDEMAKNGGLEGLRRQIDVIDDEIINLIKKRQNIAKEIGNIKREKNMNIVDFTREQEIINRLSRDEIEKEDVEKLYSVIFEISKKAQK